MRTLYLCYFGLREPLVQTQVLPYLREMHTHGTEIFLLTFEPNRRQAWEANEMARWKTVLRDEGIEWQALAYHKWPSVPATLYDIFLGGIRAARLARRHRIPIFHARAHMAMAMAMIARWLVGGKTIFDFRGLVADEYVDAGIWTRSSPVYRIFKAFERRALRSADEIVVLTRKMKSVLLEREGLSPDRIEVIPCCVNFSRFRELPIPEKGPLSFVVVYAGSVTGLYLFREMVEIFLAMRKRWPGAVFQVLTGSSHDWVRASLLGVGLKESEFEILRVSPESVPQYLMRATVGVSFRKATWSQTAASPTKVGEYLAAGLPVISNAGIGDMDELIQSNRVGLVLSDLSRDSYNKAIDELAELLVDPALAMRCRAAALAHFDLHTIGGTRYAKVYQRLWDCPF